MTRRRLDSELVRRGLLPTRSAAHEAIAAGEVLVRGLPASRPATLVAADDPLALAGDLPRWAGRGGRKLAGALEAFGVDPAGKHCLDVGASTGGFTDVLLRGGAAGVTAVDVGYGQLDGRLREDRRVTVHDRTNFRLADPATLGAPFDLVVADVSFISLRTLAPNLAACGRAGTEYLVLVKPQFEVGRERLGRRGVVDDPNLQRGAVVAVAAAFSGAALAPQAVCASPITGAAGNREFFLYAVLGSAPRLDAEAVDRVVAG
ncbi:MAG: TlyA family RNA methyltransferase [Actinobacteria bacterium]|nr:TlyA family RNA methyltransferase [Actinomycetota bacterium]